MTSGSSHAYVEFYDSVGGGGRFRVPEGGYKPMRDKSGAINKTANGGVDQAVGAIYEVHQYNIWVRDEEDETGFKDRAELMRLWALNNPYGSPTNKITFIDHFNNSHTVLMVGQEQPQPQTTIISGLYAWFIYPVTLYFI